MGKNRIVTALEDTTSEAISAYALEHHNGNWDDALEALALKGLSGTSTVQKQPAAKPAAKKPRK